MEPIGFKAIKVVALAVTDMARARRFYGETLGLPPASENGEQVGHYLGDIVLMLKDDWYGRPTEAPNPRLTIDTVDARATQQALRERGVVISDPVERYGDYLVGGFLDSEGNKLCFCSCA